MTSKHILAAVLVVAAAITVSGSVPEVAKATAAITRIDLSAVQARIMSKMKLKHFAPYHSRGSVVRGRSLIETALCEYDAAEGVCEPGLEATKNFRPATPEGQKLVDMLFKPEIECRALTTMATCVADSRCLFEENECASNSEAIMGNPPPSSCSAAEKVPVTVSAEMLEQTSSCAAFTDEATCTGSCAWTEVGCASVTDNLIGDVMMSMMRTNSTFATLMKVDVVAKECEMRVTIASSDNATTCEADSRCEWHSDTKTCDITENATMSIMGVEATNGMTDVMQKMMTCALSNATSCAAPCVLGSSNACILGEDAIVTAVGGGLEDGPIKDMVMRSFMCGIASEPTAEMCESMGCSYTPGESSCDYQPDEAAIMGIMTSPAPGYEARCPSLMDKMMAPMMTCASSEVSACPATCEVVDEGEGPECTLAPAAMYSILAGEEDGKNMAEVEKACTQHKGDETSCAAQTMDLDFFGKKFPSKKKVKTAISFKGVTEVDSEATQKMRNAIASTIGGDVTAEDITFTRIHFPVKATLKLTTSMTDVTADKPAFEAKFKTGAAADLNVKEADIVISAITEASRRRGLLETGVNVAFTVENTADATIAQAISSSISTAAGLTSIASQTGATATVAEAPSFELEVEMEVATADSATVSTKISDTGTATALVDSLATEGISGATVTVTETPTVQENTSVASTTQESSDTTVNVTETPTVQKNTSVASTTQESSGNRAHAAVVVLLAVFAVIIF